MYVIYYLSCQYYPLSLLKFHYKTWHFRLGHLFIRSGLAVANGISETLHLKISCGKRAPGPPRRLTFSALLGGWRGLRYAKCLGPTTSLILQLKVSAWNFISCILRLLWSPDIYIYIYIENCLISSPRKKNDTRLVASWWMRRYKPKDPGNEEDKGLVLGVMSF